MGRATRAIIDLAAVVANANRVRQFAPNAQLMAVVKADAYGHGAPQIASALYDHCDAFAVATIDEGLALRKSFGERTTFKPITVLSAFQALDEADTLAAARLSVVIQDPAQIELLAKCRNGLSVWIKVNTGMNRAGLDESGFEHAMRALSGLSTVRLLGLMSHFACADEAEHPLNNTQLSAFQRYLRQHVLGPGGVATMANSAAICAMPASHFDMVRPGLMLYGASPLLATSATALQLEPAMSLRAAITGIRTVRAGDSVGYGATWTANATTRIALVGCGYGDGYPRGVGNGTAVGIGDAKAFVTGRVSMDSLSVDVTHLPEVKYGDEVELWGKRIPVAEVAAAAGTIPYELLTRVTTRVKRIYRHAAGGQ